MKQKYLHTLFGVMFLSLALVIFDLKTSPTVYRESTMKIVDIPKAPDYGTHLNVKYWEGRKGDSREVLIRKSYIRRFQETARREQSKLGIPASISMAQGILESGSGRSKLARLHNNHFGVKCFSKTCGKGHCINFNDDHHKDFFVKYKTAWESWRAHSRLLKGKRYADLNQYGTDYREWARGLKKRGYATAKNYDERLIKIIEEYNLQYLDKFPLKS